MAEHRSKVSGSVWTVIGILGVTFAFGIPAFSQAQPPSREYIRLNGRVIAIENLVPSGTPVTVSLSTGTLEEGQQVTLVAGQTVNWTLSG